MRAMAPLSRRAFLELGLSASALAATGCGGSSEDDTQGWERGDLQHLLPTVSQRAFNLKLSFHHPAEAAPLLEVRGPGEPRRILGHGEDTHGRFFSFRVAGLSPATTYRLRLFDAAGAPLCDEWPLRTFPAPDATPERLRVVSYTCAGGLNLPIPPSLYDPFKPTAYRHALLAHAMAQQPDLVIANGDHVYFDLPAVGRALESPFARLLTGFLEGSVGRLAGGGR